MSAFTFAEENLHDFRHVNLQEHVRVAKNRSEGSKNHRFSDGIIGEVFLAEGRYSEIPLDHEGTIETTEDTEEHKEDQLKKVPTTVIFNLEHDQLSSSERVYGLFQVSNVPV